MSAINRPGWVTYSPDFALDFVHHPDVTWRR
jgi:hypothetical protein